jgi:mitochondrial chaperone BCS1
VSLSVLLNIIDGIGLQKGRILIMTTNHIIRLDKAFIRPGRIDKKIKLGLADNQMAANLFCLVFKPVESDVAFTEDA